MMALEKGVTGFRDRRRRPHSTARTDSYRPQWSDSDQIVVDKELQLDQTWRRHVWVQLGKAAISAGGAGCFLYWIHGSIRLWMHKHEIEAACFLSSLKQLNYP